MKINFSNIEGISKEIIEKYFKSLQHLSILLKETHNKNVDFFAAASIILHKKQYKIRLNPEIYKMNIDAIKGCIAHEIAHIELLNKKSGLKLFKHLLMLTMDDPYLSKHEREADELVIKKGLGKELLAFQKYHDQNYENYDESDGLTESEIEIQIKQLQN